jgi:WD40 repeat protein
VRGRGVGEFERIQGRRWKARLANVKVKQVPHALELVRRYPTGLATSCVSPDGKACLFADADLARVIMWDLQSGSIVHSFQIEHDPGYFRGMEKFRSISWSDDGRYIIAGGHGGTVAIWNSMSGDLEVIIKDRIDATLGYLMCATLSKSNQFVLVGAMYGAFVFT